MIIVHHFHHDLLYWTRIILQRFLITILHQEDIRNVHVFSMSPEEAQSGSVVMSVMSVLICELCDVTCDNSMNVQVTLLFFQASSLAIAG